MSEREREALVEADRAARERFGRLMALWELQERTGFRGQRAAWKALFGRGQEAGVAGSGGLSAGGSGVAGSDESDEPDEAGGTAG